MAIYDGCNLPCLVFVRYRIWYRERVWPYATLARLEGFQTPLALNWNLKLTNTSRSHLYIDMCEYPSKLQPGTHTLNKCDGGVYQIINICHNGHHKRNIKLPFFSSQSRPTRHSFILLLTLSFSLYHFLDVMKSKGRGQTKLSLLVPLVWKNY